MRLLGVLVLFCYLSNTVVAQESGTLDAVTTGQAWYEVNFTHAVKRFVIQCDLQLNNSNDSMHQYNLSKHVAQYGAIGWVHYYITPRVKLSASLGYWNNKEITEVNQLPSAELRPSIQVQHLFNKRGYTLYNRIRFDNRFVHHKTTNEYTYTPRLRYMPKIVVPLNSKSIRKKTCYAIAHDEIFLNIMRGRLIDQNAATIGLGYCFTDNVVLEVCYTRQNNYRTNAPYEITNALALTLTVNNVLKVIKGK